MLFGLADLAAALSPANSPAGESTDLSAPLWEEELQCAKCNNAAPSGGNIEHKLKGIKFTACGHSIF